MKALLIVISLSATPNLETVAFPNMIACEAALEKFDSALILSGWLRNGAGGENYFEKGTPSGLTTVFLSCQRLKTKRPKKS